VQLKQLTLDISINSSVVVFTLTETQDMCTDNDTLMTKPDLNSWLYTPSNTFFASPIQFGSRNVQHPMFVVCNFCFKFA